MIFLFYILLLSSTFFSRSKSTKVSVYSSIALFVAIWPLSGPDFMNYVSHLSRGETIDIDLMSSPVYWLIVSLFENSPNLFAFFMRFSGTIMIGQLVYGRFSDGPSRLVLVLLACYFLTYVQMGYWRQFLALSFAIYAYFRRLNLLMFVAAAIHPSSLIIYIAHKLTSFSQKRFLRLAAQLVFMTLIVLWIQSNSYIINVYISRGYQSNGFWIRLLFVAILFLSLRRNIDEQYQKVILYIFLSCLVLGFINTILGDRILVSLFVFIPLALDNCSINNRFIVKGLSVLFFLGNSLISTNLKYFL